jgi:hypothetical protein
MSIVRSSAQVRIPDAMNGDKNRMGNFGSMLELLHKNPDCFTGWQWRAIGLLAGRPRQISDAQTN